jgi:hypothetical protein
MSHISIFQPDDSAGLEPVGLPHSYLVLNWAVRLNDMDPSSQLFLSDLQQFLEGRGRHTLAQLRGSAAAGVADFFDMVRKPDSIIIASCDRSIVSQLIRTKLQNHPEYRRRTLRVLRSLSGSWGVLPASYTLQGEVEVSNMGRWGRAGFSVVWRGTLGREEIAIKVIDLRGGANPKKLKKVGVVTQQWHLTSG